MDFIWRPEDNKGKGEIRKKDVFPLRSHQHKPFYNSGDIFWFREDYMIGPKELDLFLPGIDIFSRVIFWSSIII
ncbi:hypothetical protein A3K55_00545 [Candidatus Shapirobacteria bacterium RBG_13_44_7]|uniref:Uncharacterized protein n=1 Tax=Candidatus Shapirobacteria bacterium RBG_13_44_7 TaxID=1802149 RepID=A0A1F7SEU8_9BACT|nr:MAG: hypothetical protein A3K55_00545 [Candidatus Shapirobacteria bacterium RBG_13_44_7]